MHNLSKTPAAIRQIFLLLSIAASAANAAFISIDFTGTVTGRSGGVAANPRFATGQPLTGTYAYDSLSPDLDSDPTVGRYAIIGASASFADYTVSSGSSGRVIVKSNGYVGGPSLSLDLLPVSGAPVFTLNPIHFTWGLASPQANDSLPTTPCNACLSGGNSGVLIFDAGAQVQFHVDSFATTPTPAPEPSTFLLLTSGLLAVLCAGRRYACRSV